MNRIILSKIKNVIKSFLSPLGIFKLKKVEIEKQIQEAAANGDLISLMKLATKNKPWYYHLFPFLPRTTYNKELKMLSVVFADTSTTIKSLTKTHFIDVLIRNHKEKWYHFKYVGFQIWRPW